MTYTIQLRRKHGAEWELHSAYEALGDARSKVDWWWRYFPHTFDHYEVRVVTTSGNSTVPVIRQDEHEISSSVPA